MKKWLRRLVKFIAYTAATIVIALAILLGLFRVFLPSLPAYQDEIKSWTSSAVGMQVEFSGMDARWGLSGPELEFYDAELIQPDSGRRVVAAAEVRVGVGLLRLLVDRTLVVDRVVVRDTSIDVQQQADGSIWVQGNSTDDLLTLQTGASDRDVNIEFIGEDVEVRYMRPGDERPQFFDVTDVHVSVDNTRIAVDAGVRLPRDLGEQMQVTATQLRELPVRERRWDVSVEGEELALQGWSHLVPDMPAFNAGSGDIELSVAIENKRLRSVSALVDFADVGLGREEKIDVAGRLEAEVADDGWLIAANDLILSFPDHRWPETSLRLEAGTASDGAIVVLDMRATYLNLDDLDVIQPVLSESLRKQFAAVSPSGEITDLVATVSDVGSESSRFDVSAELVRVGIATAPGRPGIRGFSGTLRANRSGGRLEIQSTDLTVNAPDMVRVPITLNRAQGTVIWRSSKDRTTILSDSISVDNDFLESQSNVQLVLNHAGGSPEIDLSSRWSISDIAGAKQYIPVNVMKPKLYDWFQGALVGGAISRGTTELNGPLDRFPFDGGEGRLLINAAVRNMTFKYHPKWPAADQASLDVVLDNARLYSVDNRSSNAGNEVVNASVEIADLRDPVLRIKSLSTGSLESIRQFSLRSPIAAILGGQLDKVSASGEASFTLDLTVPLKSVPDFEFVSRVRSNNGSLSIAGFTPAVTDLIGEVTIERDRISSESLGGRFLGEAVDINLTRADDPKYSVVATASGITTAAAIVNELGAPLTGLIEGRTPYNARILFPARASEEVQPLTVVIESELRGLLSSLPAPFSKAAEDAMPVSGELRFQPGGEAIQSVGSIDSRVAWKLDFARSDERWDFDRGVLALGAIETREEAATRGLHIRGATPTVRLQDWLNLSRSGEKNLGAADRIRSIDILVDDLYLLGQHLQGHRVKVDRSALDWLVQFDGDDVLGSVFVPYDFGSDRAMVLEMQKLRLPGDDQPDAAALTFDPRQLPPITVKADEFAFGDRYVGAVDATIAKTVNGLEANRIQSKDETFEIVGSGGWTVDDTDPLGSRSYITATLTSTDVERTMARLNYEPGIRSDDMGMLFDLSWSGGPRADFFDSLDGDVQVRMATGQLEEVEPGAGRMFGLMSIVALPRRLSLDFRDVFSKGFAFDSISGSFKIVDGDTYTCDLSLEGPAADIGIVGAADIAGRTYDQTAIVSAKVGNTLPIVGAVVAGPQVAAALLIFSQIFKKPLEEVGQVYYAIGGSWDAPLVDSTDSNALVRSGDLAGCLTDVNAQ